MAENIISVELWFTVSVALASFQLVVFGFFAKKYIWKIDNNESNINQIKIDFNELKTEHCMIQKDKTGMN